MLCAALPAGNHDDYWRVLWDNGRITKERLETMHNPIKGRQQAAPCCSLSDARAKEYPACRKLYDVVFLYIILHCLCFDSCLLIKHGPVPGELCYQVMS
jgi:hypothetical protein